MKPMPAEIDDTYAEAFDGLFTRLLVTGRDLKRLRKAAQGSTALPSVVIGRTEGGVERWLGRDETPDGRVGALLQFWGFYDRTRIKESVQRFHQELSYRIRQGILVVPTTALYNAIDSGEKLDMMQRVGHCGDGYESEEDFNGRRIIRIPLMMGDFVVERYLGYDLGVAGGNLWLFCKNERAALRAGEKVVAAVESTGETIAPFDVCSAGSKTETKYPEIGPTTNHLYCPTLREKIPDSMVPRGVTSIPEVVINGTTLEAVERAMQAGISAARGLSGVVRISAGNYGGKLGKYRIYLRGLQT